MFIVDNMLLAQLEHKLIVADSLHIGNMLTYNLIVACLLAQHVACLCTVEMFIVLLICMNSSIDCYCVCNLQHTAWLIVVDKMLLGLLYKLCLSTCCLTICLLLRSISNMLPVPVSLRCLLLKMCFIASIDVAVLVVVAFALQIANVVVGSEFVFNSP